MPFVANRLVVASRLALRWAAKQPLLKRPHSFRKNGVVSFGSAAQPNAGQACSPQGQVQASEISEEHLRHIRKALGKVHRHAFLQVLRQLFETATVRLRQNQFVNLLAPRRNHLLTHAANR